MNTTRIVVRQGNHADLHALLPGEQGYATDTHRLFIGNYPIELPSLGALQTEYSFGIDLDGTHHYLSVGDRSLSEGTHYIVKDDGTTIKFLEGHEPNNGEVIRLQYNTEVVTKVPEEDMNDTVVVASLPAPATRATIHTVSIDTSRYSSTEFTYEITDGVEYRKGKLTAVYLADHVHLSDEYTTTNESELPHEFQGSIIDNMLVLSYTTDSTNSFNFKYTEQSWSV